MNEVYIAYISAGLGVLVILSATALLIHDVIKVNTTDTEEVADHRKDHILIISILAFGYVWFLHAFVSANGIQATIDTALVDTKMSYGLAIFNLGLLKMLWHINEELLDDDE